MVLEVGGLRAAMDKAFPELDLHWLHTEDGEDCVCVITAARQNQPAVVCTIQTP